MTVESVVKDLDELTMELTNSFDAPIERVWQLWADPRLLERWWGPPTYPATFEEHDLSPGGRVTYFMTSPEGDKHAGWWRVIAVDELKRLHLKDGFSDADGNPNEELPTTEFLVDFSERADGRTEMKLTTSFASPEAFEQLMEMGMEEGIVAAAGQIDALL